MRRISLIIGLVCFFSSGNVFALNSVLKEAEIFILRERYLDAARECEKVLKNSSGDDTEKACYFLGLCLLKQSQYEKARDNFEIIARKFSRGSFYDDAMLGIAEAYFQEGEFKEAHKRYAKFLHACPDSELISIALTRVEQCKESETFTDSCFSVQLGCFNDKDNAENLRDELINGGFQGYIVKLPDSDLYRVRVGRFYNRMEAESLAYSLISQGYTTRVCP